MNSFLLYPQLKTFLKLGFKVFFSGGPLGSLKPTSSQLCCFACLVLQITFPFCFFDVATFVLRYFFFGRCQLTKAQKVKHWGCVLEINALKCWPLSKGYGLVIITNEVHHCAAKISRHVYTAHVSTFLNSAIGIVSSLTFLEFVLCLAFAYYVTQMTRLFLFLYI